MDTGSLHWNENCTSWCRLIKLEVGDDLPQSLGMRKEEGALFALFSASQKQIQQKITCTVLL